MNVYIVEIAGADVTPRVFFDMNVAWVLVMESESIDEEIDGTHDELIERLRFGSDIGGKDWSIYVRGVE